MKRLIFTLLIIMGLVMPALAQENPYALETKVIQNQQKLKLLEQQQAQLYLKIDNLLVKYGEIKGELDDIRHRLDTLQNQINEILLRNVQIPAQPPQPTITTPKTPTAPKVSKPVQENETSSKATTTNTTAMQKQIAKSKKPLIPSKPEDRVAFDKALKLFKAKKYDQAVEAFKNFKNRFKTSKLVPDAIFFIAESYYAKGEYDKAIINYDYLVNTYPKCDKAAQATLKEGLAFIKMGDNIDGKYLLHKVVRQYPNTKAAKEAERYLKKG